MINIKTCLPFVTVYALVAVICLAGVSAQESREGENGAGAEPAGKGSVKVTLNAGASVDPDGDKLSFEWRQVSGPPVVLYDAATAQPYFYAVEPGTYSFTVRAFDGELMSEPVTVTRMVHGSNYKPVAVAGKDRKVRVGDTFILDGRGSSDIEGNALSYEWMDLSGPSPLLGKGGSNKSLVRLKPARTGTYIVRLRVFDGTTWSDPAEVRIDVLSPNRAPIVKIEEQGDVFLPDAMVENRPPVARVAPGVTVKTGQWVLMDGSASYDLDGDAIVYFWYQESGPRVRELHAVRGKSMVKFQPEEPGVYVFRLIVSDRQADSSPETVTINAYDENSPPEIRLPKEVQGVAGQKIVLDGSSARDPEGEEITGKWKQVSGPRVVDFFVDNAERGLVTAFTPSEAGEYVFELAVTDSSGHSASTAVRVIIAPSNHAPLVEAPSMATSANGSADIKYRAIDPDGDKIETAAKVISGRMNVKSLDKEHLVLSDVEEPGIVRLFIRDGRGGVSSADIHVEGTGPSPGPLPIVIKGVREGLVGRRLVLVATIVGDKLAESGVLRYQWMVEGDGMYLSPEMATEKRLVLYPEKPGVFGFQVKVWSGDRIGSAQAIVQVKVLGDTVNVSQTVDSGKLTAAKAVQLLASKDDAERDLAAAFLVDMGRAALPELSVALVGDNLEIRQEVSAIIEYITGEPARKLITQGESGDR